jgi:sigma-B regulation protein RsbU (phosphoserine phosphatase)
MSSATGNLIPAEEPARLAAVRRYDVLDTPPDGAFDRITALAARHFDVPIAIVTVVDTDRIWFKSRHGIEASEIGRDPGLCASAILQSEPWIVEDAASDPRTIANPLVAGEMGLGFYAGAPLTTHDGHNLGTLCIIDQKPRVFSSTDADVLAQMSAVVMDELELRLAARQVVESQAAQREQAEETARILQDGLLPDALPEIDGLQLASLFRPADAGIVGGDFYDVFQAEDAWVLVVGDVSGKGIKAAGVTALARHTIRAAGFWTTDPVKILDTLNQSILIGRKDPSEIDYFCTVLVAVARRTTRGLSLSVATAGHPPCLVLRGDGTVEELGQPGPPAGCYRQVVYHEDSTELHAGEGVVLFTDGITEARTQTGLLQSSGLISRLQSNAPSSAHEVIAVIQSLLDSGDVDVRDDVAALALNVD